MLLVIDIEHPWLAPRMLCFSTNGRKKEGTPEGILGHAEGRLVMGDPFRVDSEDIEKIRGCIQLRFMHPRLLRVVPFRDMHQAHCCAFRRLAACVPGNETPQPCLRQISF